MNVNETIDEFPLIITKDGKQFGPLEVKVGIIGETGIEKTEVSGIAVVDIPADVAQALGIQLGLAELWRYTQLSDTVGDEGANDLWDHVYQEYPDILDDNSVMRQVTLTVDQFNQLTTQAKSNKGIHEELLAEGLNNSNSPKKLVDEMLDDA